MTAVNTDKIEAALVLLQIDGVPYWAPLAGDKGVLFVKMLSAFQSGESTALTLHPLPPAIGKQANDLAVAVVASAQLARILQ